MINAAPPKPKPEWEVALRQLKKNRPAMTGFWVLAVLYFFMFFSGFISPYDQTFSDPGKNFHPPVRIHFIDARGHFHPRPFIYDYIETPPFSRHYVPDASKIYPLHFFAGRRLLSVDGPARLFLFGSDDSGRDVFSRILYGSRVALSIGIVGVIISYFLGVIIGGLSGYYAGKPIPLGWWWEALFTGIGAAVGYATFRDQRSFGLISGGAAGIVFAVVARVIFKAVNSFLTGRPAKAAMDVDNWIQRTGEMFMMFPSLYLLLGLRALIPENISSTKVYFLIVVILSFIRWPAIARIVRGLVLSIREREFVTAAEAVGASNFRIVVRHIIPNTFSQIIVLVTLSIPTFILGEAFLSFLDLGIREPQASWGNMLTQAQDVVALTHYPWILLPGLFIFITVLGFNLLGDGLRDALDPKMRT